MSEQFEKSIRTLELPRVLELLSAWKGEAHIFRSPAQCADFLNRLE